MGVDVGRVYMGPRAIRWRGEQGLAIVATALTVGLWAVAFFAVTPVFGRMRVRAVEIFTGTPYCDGLAPTIVGTANDDILYGTAGPDVIVGLDGNDRIYGNGGGDWLCGNSGDDMLVGDDGADRLLGNIGNDTLIGGNGSDTLRAGDGDDMLDGGSGDDTLEGGDGDDGLEGGSHLQQDYCYGGRQNAGDSATGCEIIASIP
jgi:hypothetical protein